MLIKKILKTLIMVIQYFLGSNKNYMKILMYTMLNKLLKSKEEIEKQSPLKLLFRKIDNTRIKQNVICPMNVESLTINIQLSSFR